MPVEANLTGSEKWEFDAEVADAFDDMLSRSIPGYAAMRQLCFNLGSRFVAPKTDIVDLGCSRGGALSDFVRKFGALNRYYGCDVSDPMLAAARERFSGYISAGVVDVRRCDLREDYPPAQASLTLCVLTLQFTPIEHRLKIVQAMHDHSLAGGAVLLVEKVLGRTAASDATLVGAYLDHKRREGYTEDEIRRKKLSLEGVLVPCTARWHEDMLADVGFRHVERFWQHLNFCGWFAVR